MSILQAVEHLEGEFDIEAIRIDLPLFSKAVEMETASLSVKGVPRHGEYLLSLKVGLLLSTLMKRSYSVE